MHRARSQKNTLHLNDSSHCKPIAFLLNLQYMKLPEPHERESLEDRLPTLAPEAIKFLQVSQCSSFVAMYSVLKDNFTNVANVSQVFFHLALLTTAACLMAILPEITKQAILHLLKHRYVLCAVLLAPPPRLQEVCSRAPPVSVSLRR